MSKPTRTRRQLEYDREFSARMREAAAAARMTFKDVARATGINYNSVLGYANGHTSPCAYYVTLIAEATGADAAWLVKGVR